ncbi:hypothetical protein PGSY75_0708200 [Plasmodium gaboni]|uniref:Uncharacterized protein n=1 Tax=Plasmodium gaboni TaxID=647221 RepID=A0A151LPS8_9APIC|nr:hypothetical protein PGSY75_0708200 [Plasmodium gaboni]KYO01243.1 hypothetical protein PGSY75_0708200 [Plasmodium gaboni]
MNISVKESLEHVCEVFSFFGIDYISAEILRRGKNDKKIKRRKVIIRYNFLINDLCLLYFFEFTRRFKPSYNDYIKKEITKKEEKYIKGMKRNERNINNNINNNININNGDDYDDNLFSDDEDYLYEGLDDDTTYFDDFNLICPLVILLLEYFEYPRLYQLLKCHFQNTKELLLCIGFLIDSTKLFEQYDKRQIYYEEFFKNIHNNNNNNINAVNNNRIKKDAEKINEENNNNNKEYYHFYHYINEAMNLLCNKPYDIEMFQYKYFYNFLESLKKKKRKKKENFRMDNKRKYDNKSILKENNKINDKFKCDNIKINDKFRCEQNYIVDRGKSLNNVDKDYIDNFDDIDIIEKNFITLIDYIHYDYSTYQEEFLNYYYSNIYSCLEEDDIYLDENTQKLYTKEIIKNINKNCNKSIQIFNKIQRQIFHLEHIDHIRIKLFCQFNDIVTAYIQPHNGILHISNYKQNIMNTEWITDKWGFKRKIKKINLENNFLFNISIDNEKENNSIIIGLSQDNNIKAQDNNNNNKNNNNNNNNNNNMSHINMTKKCPNISLSHTNNKKNVTNNYESSEFFEDINLDILEEKININEFFILNNISLYNNIIHIYKNGKYFFSYEQLRAVFWIWIQSLFSDMSYLETDIEEEKLKEKDNINVNVDFFDINNNKFFYDNIAHCDDNNHLQIHILSDITNFEMNYRLVKEYLNEKGCTCGYNKVIKNDEEKSTHKLNNIIKYINNLHIEYDAFYNYKKKSKNLKGDMFVEYLEEKKKNMVINSNIEKEDYTTLSYIVNKNLIPIDKILNYNPSLDFSYIIQGIKHNNYIKTSININELQEKDWYHIYIYHKNKKNKSLEKKMKHSSTPLNQNFINNEYNNIIRLTSSSKYRINQKPSTYASTIFQYSEQFISNNDIYTFADNLYKKKEHFLENIKTKQHKCKHNFYHLLSKVETYMNCVAYNL